ncbi:MAG: 23S rRNA (guanosine(2251)-2'-O)-methyltransferase RlmB [Spirochaetota bacterium]|nr:23S rRNA (guanosine(2251)-2'-O)-methyltransferase RlmB [Spirochaetota bacterium]
MSALFLYGKNAVLEYLRSSSGEARGTLYIARDPQSPEVKYALERARLLGLVCVACSRRELAEHHPGIVHQGFVLERSSADARPDMDAVEFDWQAVLGAAVDRGEKPKVLILDQVQDPGNLGAIVRSAAQFGIAAIFIPREKASGLTPAARKSASGGENFVPVVRAANLARLLDLLKAMGFWIAAACNDGGTALAAFDFNFPYAIILGSEGRGVRRLLLEKADQRLVIPMTGHIDSLNVSVAAGIIMYAMYAQKIRNSLP